MPDEVVMTPLHKAAAALEERLGYAFRDKGLLHQALTHASAVDGAHGKRDNERMEFLGDRVLGLMVASALMEIWPDADEGELSRRLHALVSRAACAEIALALDVGSAIRMSPGEVRSGGRRNLNILGNTMEALMGAVYLDSGYDTARDTFRPLWEKGLRGQGRAMIANPKSFLQEWAAANALRAPVYEVLGRSGPDHAPVFTVCVTLDGRLPQKATGRSRQEAEKAAALHFIEQEKLT